MGKKVDFQSSLINYKSWTIILIKSLCLYFKKHDVEHELEQSPSRCNSDNYFNHSNQTTIEMFTFMHAYSRKIHVLLS